MTPRAVPLLKALVRDASVSMTPMRTDENSANLAQGFVQTISDRYGEMPLGRRELDGAHFRCLISQRRRKNAMRWATTAFSQEVIMTNFTDAVFTSETTWIWFAKMVGAMAGSAVSLAYMLPHGKREAAIRFAVGIICGMVFGGAAGVKISETLALGGLLGRAELMLMGSAAASLAAWSALGIFKRFSERLKQAPIPGILPEERGSNGDA